MEQNLNSDKTPARPSHQAVESKVGSGNASGKDEQHAMDEVAMKAAKRAGNRFRNDEGVVPGSTEFTK